MTRDGRHDALDDAGLLRLARRDPAARVRVHRGLLALPRLLRPDPPVPAPVPSPIAHPEPGDPR